MATKCMGLDLNNEGILCVAFCPGWVRTTMGGPNATLAPEDTVAAMIKSMKAFGPESQGKFFNRQGKQLDW